MKNLTLTEPSLVEGQALSSQAAIDASIQSSMGRRFTSIFDAAGIVINGPAPQDVTIKHKHMFRRALREGSLGFGNSYIEGWWDCDSLDQTITQVLRAGIYERISKWTVAMFIQSVILNPQTVSKSRKVGKTHYDVGNNLYSKMLDQRMIYSCGYWKDANTLDEAQEAKLDLVARKLELEPGMRVLDIGCGWGGAARFMAERYGVKVLGISISKEQIKYAKEAHQDMPGLEFRLEDYRNLSDRFDRIYSIGMFEHVGMKNYATYFQQVRRLLEPDGLSLLHTIGSNESVKSGDAWISEHIFPNSMLPSITQIASAIENVFVVEDWHNFGPDYDRTLMHWYQRFNKVWPELESSYSPEFYRKWRYYLLSCVGTFRSRRTQLWQVVLSPRGRMGGYIAPR